MRASRSRSPTVTPTSSTYCMQLDHITSETSHGSWPEPTREAWVVVRWTILWSNSMVNATSTLESSADNGRRSATATTPGRGTANGIESVLASRTERAAASLMSVGVADVRVAPPGWFGVRDLPGRSGTSPWRHRRWPPMAARMQHQSPLGRLRLAGEFANSWISLCEPAGRARPGQ